MRLALIENSRVKNIIKGHIKDYPNYVDVTSVRCGIGWLDNGDGTFTDDIVHDDPIDQVSELKELLRQAMVIANTL